MIRNNDVVIAVAVIGEPEARSRKAEKMPGRYYQIAPPYVATPVVFVRLLNTHARTHAHSNSDSAWNGSVNLDWSV